MASEELSLWCTAQFYDVDCKNGLHAKKGKDNLWKTCIWNRNSDGATCTIEAKDEWTTTIEQCDSSLGQVNIIGGNRMECRINIPYVEMKDLGNWTCKMEKCNDEEKGGCGHKDSGDCSEEDAFYVAVVPRVTMMPELNLEALRLTGYSSIRFAEDSHYPRFLFIANF